MIQLFLMKSILAGCDRNKGKCKKMHQVEEMRKMVRDESVGACDTDEKRQKSDIEGTKRDVINEGVKKRLRWEMV